MYIGGYFQLWQVCLEYKMYIVHDSKHHQVNAFLAFDFNTELN